MPSSLECPELECWAELLRDEAADEERAAWEQHLESCSQCQARLDRNEAPADDFLQFARELGDPTTLPTDPTLADVLTRLREGCGDAAEEDLFFLEPTERPDLLGMLGHYEVTAVLGRGGMGIVLKAFDPTLHRHVAIKVMNAAIGGNATARRRFTREAHAAAKVDHENLVAVHSVHESAGLSFLVMQFIAGESLQTRLDREGPLAVDEIVRIGQEIAAGLAAAHAQGLVHRDIKPANVLLETRQGDKETRRQGDGETRAKIADFGLARIIDDVQLTQSGVVTGTPEYMSPEQARGEPVDHRTDLFSLGSVMYAMNTGHSPFRAASAVAVLRQVSDDAPPPLRDVNPRIPAWLEAIVQRLMAKAPSDRFQSAAEVAALCQSHLDHLRNPETSPLPAHAWQPDIAEPAASTRGNGWHFAALAASVLVLLTSAFWLAQGVVQPDPKDKDAKPNETQEYFHTLRGDLLAQKGFELFGTNADELVKFEPTGMRLDLPPGVVGGRPNMGLSIPMTVKGDFEITLSFELLKEPEPQDAGDSGTRFSLGIFKQTPRACVATISRSVSTKQGSLFVSWWHLWTTEEAQPPPRAFTSPTKIKSGRLRLVRNGSMLTFLVGDGEKEPHVIKTNENFGNENLRLVRLSAATGSERAALNVRLTDLRIRSGIRPVIRSPDGQVITKKPFQHIEILFNKGLNQHNLELVGRDAESMAKADAQGLRVNVPAERGDHGLVGVESKYRLHGDFDVTLAYELLGLPEPAPPLGAGLQLWIQLENTKGANVTRMQKPGGGTFGANKIDPGPDGKDLFTGFINVPAHAKTGQLRLTRTGTKLIFQVADGAAAFAQPKIIDFETGDVVNVRAVCNTGWAAFPLDVRFIRLDLKAEQIPNDPNRASADAEAAIMQESGSHHWLFGGALAVCALSGLSVAGFSLMLVMRLRRRAAKITTDGTRVGPAVAPTISFMCAKCNKKLRVKADASGKKIKCPHCGATTSAPAAPPRKTALKLRMLLGVAALIAAVCVLICIGVSSLLLKEPPLPTTQSSLHDEAEKVRRLETDSIDARSFVKVTDKDLIALRDLPNLKRLNIDHTEVTNAGMPEIAKIPSLRVLSLSKTQVDDAGLAQLKAIIGLEDLRLDSIGISDAGLAQLKAFPQLRRLSLYQTGISNDGLIHLKDAFFLEHLSLDSTRVSDRGLKHLYGLTNLRYVSVWNTAVTDAGAEELKRALLTDAGAAHLATLTNLEVLSLDETLVTDEGIKALQGLTRLKHLKLWRTSVTPAGAKDFQQKLPACKIGGLKF